MKLSKKAVMSAPFIIGIMITLVAFVVIAGTLTSFMSGFEDKELEILCHDSVALRSAAAVSFGSLKDVKVAPLLCKTIDKKISGTKDEVQRQLADAMARCWWMFNAGKIEGLLTTLEGLGSRNKGFVCYTAIIEESKDFKEGEVIDDFDDFLREKKHSKLKDVSYLNYFQSEGGGPGRVLMFLPNGEIRPNHAFEIAFVEKKGSDNDWIGPLLTGTGAAAGAAGIITLSIGLGTVGVVALTVAGIAAVVTGTQISFTEFFDDGGRDVSTIMLLDMGNKDIRGEFHKHVFTGDIAGE